MLSALISPCNKVERRLSASSACGAYSVNCSAKRATAGGTGSLACAR